MGLVSTDVVIEIGDDKTRCSTMIRSGTTEASAASSDRRPSTTPLKAARVESVVDTVDAFARAGLDTDRPAIDLRKLVAGFLRMAPDVAIVGEVRDREALPCQPRSRLRST